tara:strand:+ start:33 stop:173 length:141 start_codon:yes stop_codon:yes gene_type:complete
MQIIIFTIIIYISISLFLDTYKKVSKDPNKKLMDNIDAYDKKNKNN